MTFLGAEPADAVAAASCVREATRCLEGGDWRGGIGYLESAAIAAPTDMADSIIETLASLYLGYNQHRELANLAVLVGRMTPQLAIGGLLLVRNQRLGLGASLPPTWSLASLLPTIRQYIASGKYSGAELGMTCSLLVQLNQADMAVPLLDGMLAMAIPVEEELVTGVLALAADRHMAREIEAILEKLSRLPGVWPVRVQRYRVLLGKTEANSVPAGMDKVIDLLQRHASLSLRGKGGRG